MFETEGFETNYDAVYKGLLSSWTKDNKIEKIVTFFNRQYKVKEKGIFCEKKPIDTVGGILIMRYLLKKGEENIHNEWVPYREFKDGSNFACYIKEKIEDVIAKEFSGKLSLLEERLRSIGAIGYPHDSKPDLSMVVYAFQNLPILSVFWDKDEEFPSSFYFFFDRSAQDILDMESLAVLLHYMQKKILLEIR